MSLKMLQVVVLETSNNRTTGYSEQKTGCTIIRLMLVRARAGRETRLRCGAVGVVHRIRSIVIEKTASLLYRVAVMLLPVETAARGARGPRLVWTGVRACACVSVPFSFCERFSPSPPARNFKFL